MSTRSLICFALQLVCLWLFVSFVSEHYAAVANGQNASDFPNYYFAGTRFAEGRPVYAPLALEVKEKLGWDYLAYPADPPLTVAVLSPLSVLPYQSSWHLFLLLAIGVLTLSGWLVARELGLPLSERGTVAMLFLSSAPALFLFERAHMEFILLLVAVLGWIALRRSRTSLGGSCFAVAAAFKLFPLLWLFALGRAHGFRRIASALALFVVLSGAGVLLLGFANSFAFLTETLAQSSQWYGVVANYSLVSLGTALELPVLGWIATFVMLFSLLRMRYWRGGADEIFVKAVALSLIVSPLSWMNYQILLLPGLVILATHADTSPKRVALLLVGGIIWGFPGSVVIQSAPLLTILLSFLPLYATLALFFMSAAYIAPHVILTAEQEESECSRSSEAYR